MIANVLVKLFNRSTPEIANVGDIVVTSVNRSDDGSYYFSYKHFMERSHTKEVIIVNDAKSPRDALRRFYRALRLLAIGETFQAVDEVINPQDYEYGGEKAVLDALEFGYGKPLMQFPDYAAMNDTDPYVNVRPQRLVWQGL